MRPLQLDGFLAPRSPVGEETCSMYSVSEFIRLALTNRLFPGLAPKTKTQPDANPDAATTAPCRIFPLLFLLISAFWFPISANAACTNPTGVEGQMMYNSTSHVEQFCDNLNVWRAMGQNGPGAGGAGCSGPAGPEGQMMYNKTWH